jgi:hypothetical protein
MMNSSNSFSSSRIVPIGNEYLVPKAVKLDPVEAPDWKILGYTGE